MINPDIRRKMPSIGFDNRPAINTPGLRPQLPQPTPIAQQDENNP